MSSLAEAIIGYRSYFDTIDDPVEFPIDESNEKYSYFHLTNISDADEFKGVEGVQRDVYNINLRFSDPFSNGSGNGHN